jgi:hypothetical protein
MPIRALASVDFGDAQLEASAARSDEPTPSIKPGLARLLTPRNMSLVNGRLAMM